MALTGALKQNVTLQLKYRLELIIYIKISIISTRGIFFLRGDLI